MKDGNANKFGPPAAPDIKLDPGRSLPLPTANLSMAGKLPQKWNTKNLGLRIAADGVSAASAAALIAPVVMAIDRAITENTSGRRTLRESLKHSVANLLARPLSSLLSRPFGLIFLLYGGTYMTANIIDTATSTTRNRPATHVTSGTAKFAFGSAANVSLCVYKDQCFAQLFGPRGVVPRPVPLPTYALFAARDCLTIFASFNVPPLLGPVLNRHLSKEWQRAVSGQTIAQFAAPAAVQILSTPLHLLGLDMYNRPAGGAVTWAERWAAVRAHWAVSAVARMGRIIPAFGVGGVVNTQVRKSLMEKLL